ncbi:MAG: hypothetical protein COA68_12430 [Oceanobacter sp.]|nr:MAG: hypothetical protein COA68_12430 [Oceanobacter sp.]
MTSGSVHAATSTPLSTSSETSSCHCMAISVRRCHGGDVCAGMSAFDASEMYRDADIVDMSYRR